MITSHASCVRLLCLFNPINSPKQVILLFPFKEKKLRFSEVKNLLKATQPASDRWILM